ncbi:hypothetical protein E4U21_006570 [Claviceps maximensis]|nr:hypothetical protein E4U21_006570 [Claviceps maximensis]
MSSSKSNTKQQKQGSSRSGKSKTSKASQAASPDTASETTPKATGSFITLQFPSPEERAPPPPPPISFIFVVNELVVNYDGPETRHIGMPKDDWHNYLPPLRREQYAAEIPSEVMRFQDGSVTRASSEYVTYSWVRQDNVSEGGIVAQPVAQPAFFATPYKRASVFACNPLLPIIVAEDDVLLRPDAHYHALHFLHSRPSAISQASYQFDHPPSVALPPLISRQGPPLKYIAGSGASWIPSLVPYTYANPYRANQSGGLGGELGILLGLMAFHSVRPSEIGRTVNEVFLGQPGERSGLWKDYHWRTTSPPPGYPLSMQETPRGFFVYICFDPANANGSTEQILAMLEWQGPLIVG